MVLGLGANTQVAEHTSLYLRYDGDLAGANTNHVLNAGANPVSVWARGAEALPLDGPPKGLVDLVLPDEFPLNVFYEALRRKLGDVIESTRGITAVSA